MEEHGEHYHKQLKVWVGRLLLYSCLLYLVTCAVVYSWYLPEQTIGRVILALPFVAFPLLYVHQNSFNSIFRKTQKYMFWDLNVV